MLKQEYKEGETNLEEALRLAIKVLSKTLDMTKLTSEKGECFFSKLFKSLPQTLSINTYLKCFSFLNMFSTMCRCIGQE